MEISVYSSSAILVLTILVCIDVKILTKFANLLSSKNLSGQFL